MKTLLMVIFILVVIAVLLIKGFLTDHTSKSPEIKSAAAENEMPCSAAALAVSELVAMAEDSNKWVKFCLAKGLASSSYKIPEIAVLQTKREEYRVTFFKARGQTPSEFGHSVSMFEKWCKTATIPYVKVSRQEVQAVVTIRETTEGVVTSKDTIFPWKRYKSQIRNYAGLPNSCLIGVDDDGEVVPVPVKGVHTIVGGSSGAGKGSVLRAYVTAYAGRSDTELWGADLKSGQELKRIEHCFKYIAYDTVDTCLLIAEMARVAHEREALNTSTDESDWNIANGPRMVFLIDEAQDLETIEADPDYKSEMKRLSKLKNLTEEDEARKEALELYSENLTFVLRKARSAGVTMIVVLQSARVMNFRWSKYFTHKICLAMDMNDQAAFLKNSTNTIVLEPYLGVVQGLILTSRMDNPSKISLCKGFFIDNNELKQLPASKF